MNPKVDAFIARAKTWQSELTKLRSILLGCGLEEEMKWGKPCYTVQGKNTVIIIPFKEYCGLMFFKGVLLKDAHGYLVDQGENSQSGRQMRFTSVQQVDEMESVIKAYIQEAIEVEKLGLKVVLTKSTNLTFPEEFQSKLDEDPNLKNAFEALTPGRQRFYNIHFSSAKLSKTRISRIEKCVPLILSGKGLNDQ